MRAKHTTALYDSAVAADVHSNHRIMIFLTGVHGIDINEINEPVMIQVTGSIQFSNALLARS